MPGNGMNSQKRTMIAFTLQGIFFFVGYCFFDVNTVIPIFIKEITGRVELAGAANTLRQASTLLFQLLMGSYVIKVKNVPRYLSIFLAIGYSMPLVLVIPLLGSAAGITLAYLAFLAVTVMWICDGFVVIGYYDLLGRTVSPQNRGRVLGLQQLIGGAGAMAGAFAVKKILDLQGVDPNIKYSYIFSLGGGILLLGALAMAFSRDVPHRRPAEKYSLREELAKIPHCVRGNPAFRKVMYCQICFTIAMMSAPFILIMCRDQFGLADSQVSTLLNFQVLGTLIGGAISAFLAPVFGNRIVVIIYCILGVSCGTAGLLAFYGTGNLLPLIFIMVITSGLASASWAGFMNLIIDVSKLKDTHVYMVINSIVTLPLSVAGLAGGLIVKYYGYSALLLASLTFAVLAMLIAISLFSEKLIPAKTNGG